MKTNDLTQACCNDIAQMAQKHPTRTVIATASAGILVGVLVRLLYDQQHPTRMDTALKAVHSIGERARGLFR